MCLNEQKHEEKYSFNRYTNAYELKMGESSTVLFIARIFFIQRDLRFFTKSPQVIKYGKISVPEVRN